MGDRVGLVFLDKYGEESFVLHSHWMGRALVVAAQDFLRSGMLSVQDTCDEALVKFIGWYGTRYGVPSSMDIQDKGCYDDTEDNGVWTVDIEGEVVR